jgi:hypothetical protein
MPTHITCLELGSCRRSLSLGLGPFGSKGQLSLDPHHFCRRGSLLSRNPLPLSLEISLCLLAGSLGLWSAIVIATAIIVTISSSSPSPSSLPSPSSSPSPLPSPLALPPSLAISDTITIRHPNM